MPKLLIPIESSLNETRVSGTPETVKKFGTLGFQVHLERGAGIEAGFSDEVYEKAGAAIINPRDINFWEQTDVLLCVQAPEEKFLNTLKKSALIVGLLNPYGNSSLAEVFKKKGLSAIALEMLPRISRAQSSDALSSQANIAGYKSVLIAAGALDRYFPMLMTAAGTVQPAKVVVLGAGVAGLQAVATARRLGAVVYVSDIREAVKEQVESLGARFISPPLLKEKPTESGGYAKAVSNEFLLAQRKQLSDQLSQADVAICTAQVPGKKAPCLINDEMLDRMRPGSVVIDLAVLQGGNCIGTKQGETILRKGVKLIGAANLSCSVPNHASSLYSRNLFSLLEQLIKDGQIILNIEDELLDGCLISKDGTIRFPDVMTSVGTN